MATVINSTTLPKGKIGEEYQQEFDITGLPANAKFNLIGTLPTGIELFENTVLVGTPDQDGDFTFIYQILDSKNKVLAEKEFALSIEKVTPPPGPIIDPEDEPEDDEPEVVEPTFGQRWHAFWERHHTLRNWLIFAAIIVIAVIIFRWPGRDARTPETEATEAPVAEITEAATAEVTEAPAATEAPAETPIATEAPAVAETPEAAPIVSSDGKALAGAIWGEPLPDQPEMYSAGEDGYPQICAGLCWDTSKLDQGIMKYYGPWNGEEDISQSDAAFGDGSTGPLELMRSGKVTKVIFYLGKEAQLEVCAIGSLDGQKLSEVLDIKNGECGDRVAIQPGWHVIENNANSPISGFGVRFSASGWAGMSESQIVEYTKYWKISGDTATWVGPSDVEIMMTPSMVQMMQDFDVLHTIVFTTNVSGQVFFCNGAVSGSANLSSKDGSCQLFDVPAGTFTYSGEARLSAGISWNK